MARMGERSRRQRERERERAPVAACAKKTVSLFAHSVLSLRPCADLPHLRTAENIIGGYYLPLYHHYLSLSRRVLGVKVCDRGLAGIGEADQARVTTVWAPDTPSSRGTRRRSASCVALPPSHPHGEHSEHGEHCEAGR